MLGGLAIAQGDRRITRFQTQKTGALLAYLALHPNKAHSREALAEMLWPEGDPTAIRNRLNQAISSLRRQLHPPELGPGTVLVTDHHSVAINSKVVGSDVEEFERAIKQAERAESLADKIKNLEYAVELYKGELLEGYYEEWVFSKRMHLADHYDQALQELIRSHVEAGNPDAAIEFARLRLQLDPYDETPHVILMRLYLRAGRPKSALKQYEDLVRALQTFDDEPSEVAEKYRTKAEAQAENRAVATDDDDLPVMESRRAPETVPPPVTPREEPIPSIPRVVSTFVGRDAELTAIEDAIVQDKSRLITILGVGGCGKTRLAIEAGWRLVEKVGGHVYFIALTNIEDASDLPVEISRVVLPDKLGGADSFEAAMTRLRSTPKAVLILDNFEHIAELGSATIKTLLEALPNLYCIVTTRIPLNLDGEVQIPLTPLSVPHLEPSVTLKELAENPSVALFVERAQAVKADFQLTERTAKSIVDLCRHLEGLPLALELAASWARVMTPSQMLEQISENVDRLASRRRDINPRHRSFRAVFDGSFSLLDETLKFVFLRLTYFSGGWDYESAARLCPGVDVITAIHTLEEHSMIFSEPTDDAIRFSMLETLRSLGEGLIPPDLDAECGWLHADYFLEMTERNVPWNKWERAVSLDYSNCIAALRWFAENERSEEGLRMAVAMSRYWVGKGLLAEGREWLDLFTTFDGIDLLLNARAKSASAKLAWLAGDFIIAERSIREVIDTFRTYDAKLDEMEAQFILQLEAHRRGDYEESKRILYANLALAEALDDVNASARCWLALGNASIEQGEFDEAREYYERSIEVSRKTGTPERIAHALTNLANLSIFAGQTEAARKWLDEAASLIDMYEQRWRAAMTYLVKGRLENVEGNYEAAIDTLVEGLRTAPTEKLVTWRFLMQFGLALAGLGLTEDAIRTFGFFERYRERIGEQHRGIEMRVYEEKLEEIRSVYGEDRFNEQFNIGRIMSADEMNGLITKVYRQPIRLLEAI